MTFKDIEKACEGLKVTPIERYDRKTGKKTCKDYIDVSQRVKAFRRLYPQGWITTDILKITDEEVVIRATAGYREDGNAVILATGTAHEVKSASAINQTSYVEVCETSAVGRALGMIGIGIDSGIASADEMRSAIEKQEMHDTIPEAAAKKLQALIRQAKEVDAGAWTAISTKYGIKKVSEVKQSDYNAIVRQAADIIEKKGA